MAHPTSKLLDESLRTILAPVLRRDGYVGSGRTFRRIDGDLIRVVAIQGSRYGGQFAVNLGAHLLFLPDAIGHPVDPKGISEPLCEFRRRMTAQGSDQWWDYRSDGRSIMSAVENMVSVYEVHGRKQLAHFWSYPEAFAAVRPESLEDEFERYFDGFGSTLVRSALAFARIRAHEGDHVAAKAFAEVGLKNLGMATGLRSQLQQFVGSSSNSAVQPTPTRAT